MSIVPESTPSRGAAAGDAAEPPSQFRVQSPVEVLALLRELLDGQTRITLHSANGALLNTRLCSLETEHGAIGFDVSTRDPQLQSLLQAEEVNATAYLDSVRLAFEIEGLVLVNGHAGAVLRAALPQALFRFQRRQAFRVRPNTRTPQARLKFHQDDETLRLRIVDLSVGGVALLLPPGGPPTPADGSELEAQIELDRENHFRALLRLQHVSQDGNAGNADANENGNGSNPGGTKLGFAWAHIDPAAMRTVQLFIDQTQKLNRLLLRKA